MTFFNFTIMILICICITFWNVFLIEETFACDPGLDCFFHNDSDSDQLIAVSECSLINPNLTVVCFRFSLYFGQALGSAGGLITIASIIVRCGVIVVFFITEKVQSSDYNCIKNHSTCILRILSVIVLLPPFLIFVFFDIALFVPDLVSVLLKTPQRKMLWVSYTLTMLAALVLVATLPKLAKLPKEKNKERHTGRTNIINSANNHQAKLISGQDNSYGAINSSNS